MNLDLLREPYNETDLRRRQEAGKPAFDYVKGGDVVKRVLEATENNYTWRVTSLKLIGNNDKSGFWLCEGELTIPGLGTRSGVGTAKAMSEDMPKSAETDCFKRAAVKFGPGLQLYCEIDEWAGISEGKYKLATEAQVKKVNLAAAKLGKTWRGEVGKLTAEQYEAQWGDYAAENERLKANPTGEKPLPDA